MQGQLPAGEEPSEVVDRQAIAINNDLQRLPILPPLKGNCISQHPNQPSLITRIQRKMAMIQNHHGKPRERILRNH